MSQPLVLLALADDPVASGLHAALLEHAARLRVRACKEAQEVVEACATEVVSLVILSHRVDDNGGGSLLREVGAFATTPQAIVLFDDPGDPHRALIAQAGALDHVLPPGRELQPLVALIDRTLSRRALEARLDSASRQFRTLVDNSNDGIYILREGRFIYANHRFEQMVGFSLDEVLADDFNLVERITSPKSRAYIAERARRAAAGRPLEPRYEFVAMRKNGEEFDAQVSISYIELEGPERTKVPGALGIMQDITERKRFEDQLVRKNRELALLSELQDAINETVALDETLGRGCERLAALVNAEAVGITLIGNDERTLRLRSSKGLDERLLRALDEVALDSPSLLAQAVRKSQVLVVDDIRQDQRVAIGVVRDAAFGGCIVVPLKTHAEGEHDRRERERVLGAAFVFFAAGKKPSLDDRELLVSVGTVLGNAVEKATLLETARTSVKKLVALDEIAVALASTLDVNEVTQAVARNVYRLFGATRVMVARVSPDGGTLVPAYVLDDGEPVQATPTRLADSIMGLALAEGTPVQRVRPAAGGDPHWSLDPLDGRPVRLLPHEEEMFALGVGAAVAVPILLDGQPAGALWLGYEEATPLSPQDLGLLSSIGTHVAIASKNAALFAARNQALDDLRAAQDQLVASEKLNAIGLIAHGVAHDFNNMLGSILGRAQLLKSQLRDQALVRHAEVIEKAAIDGAETVRRIQEIGRQDRADDFVPVELDGIVADVVELTQPRWRDLTIAEGRPVDVAVEKRPDAVVAGNPSELREVLVNLVHNAVDAMPNGGTLRFSTAVADDTCYMRVTDSGTGMPDDIRHRIFDPYFTTKGERGTGLGLSVSHSIIRRHGGDIEVHSRTGGPERGTTFIISLPALPKIDAARPASLPPTAHANGRARILVVDDEANIREILAEILMNGDHEVVTAADGAEALHLLRERSDFDLVFTDLGLPGMNGYEVASEIKRINPALPVGLVTGWGATLDADKAREHGVDLVLSKPFRYDQVLGLVAEALLAKQAAKSTAKETAKEPAKETAT
ncbi:MAG: response regulator [Deltaproteobacteria bacterium]|nr:response regulator [Deltaproteobacteria bacterium]